MENNKGIDNHYKNNNIVEQLLRHQSQGERRKVTTIQVIIKKQASLTVSGNFNKCKDAQ